MIWLASPFVSKARKFVVGRKNLLKVIESELGPEFKKCIWFHAASLGEFEQGRPLIERVRNEFPKEKIVLTFFSPSGYEVRKNYEMVDHVFYLPLDTPGNARKFIELVRPRVAIFIKYEFWFNYIKTLHSNSITLLSVSSVFRESHLAFHPSGAFFRKMLRKIDYYFVQDEQSMKLLRQIGISNATVSGDTRFDRVCENARNAIEYPLIEQFKADQPTLIVGSSWDEDMACIIPVINQLNPRIKVIVAPHQIEENIMNSIASQFNGKSIRYSQYNLDEKESFDLMIIDNVGMLSTIYRYADIVFIGGGFRGALHNTIEAAIYGMPIIFGRHENNKKFLEAMNLLKLDAAFEVSNQSEFADILQSLLNDKDLRVKLGGAGKAYVEESAGASDIVMNYLRPNLLED